MLSLQIFFTVFKLDSLTWKIITDRHTMLVDIDFCRNYPQTQSIPPIIIFTYMYCRWDNNWYFLQPSPTYIYIHTYIGRQNVNIKNPKLPWESYMKTMSSRDVGTQCVYYTLECYVICIKLLLVALVVWAKQNNDCICSTWLEELLSELMKKYWHYKYHWIWNNSRLSWSGRVGPSEKLFYSNSCEIRQSVSFM